MWDKLDKLITAKFVIRFFIISVIINIIAQNL